ncbi:MAG: hypothetical protein ACFFCU_18730 [Promethearchaeota archaeon]
MENYDDYLQLAREDIEHSLEVWKSLLINEFSDKIDYIYAKGSAVKPWQSPFDYVPILSDIDIHIMLKKNKSLFCNGLNAFKKSLEISEKYERIFTKKFPNTLHLPRTQLVIINHLLKSLDYIPPRSNDVKIVYGDPVFPSIPKPHIIREIDFKKLLELHDTVERIPINLIDRTGIDYWVLIRRINWQVSPTPIRVLTQVLDTSPDEIWSWNRTKLINELENQGYVELTNHYKQYYLAGWKAFLAEYQDPQTFREVIYYGYHVLITSLEIVQELKR